MELAVNLPSLVQFHPAAPDISLDPACRLELDPALGGYAPTDLASDDGVLRDNVALHHAILADDHALGCRNRSFHATLDPDRTVATAIADYLHPRAPNGHHVAQLSRHIWSVLRHINTSLVELDP